MSKHLFVAGTSPTSASVDVPDASLLAAIGLGRNVVGDARRACAAAARAAAQLPDTMVARHDNQRRRRVPIQGPRPSYRSISSADGLFRWLTLVELETEEREQEAQPGFQLTDDELLLRFVKNQAQTILYTNSFYAVIELGQIWCDYSAATLVEMYDRVADERSGGKDASACSRAKDALQSAAIERFPSRLDLTRRGNQWRIRSTEASDRQFEIVVNGFELFMSVPEALWSKDIPCADPTTESGVEMARMRRFLNPVEFETVADAVSHVRREAPLRRVRDCLQVPAFNKVPVPDTPGPAAGAPSSDLGAVRELIDRHRVRRARVRPDTLRLEVDSIDCGTLATIHDLVLGTRAAVLRVVGAADDGDPVVVATFARMPGLSGVWDWDVSLPHDQGVRLTIAVGEDEMVNVSVATAPHLAFDRSMVTPTVYYGDVDDTLQDLRALIERLKDHVQVLLVGGKGMGKSAVANLIPHVCSERIRLQLEQRRRERVRRLDRAVERQLLIYDRFKAAAPELEPWESCVEPDTWSGRILRCLAAMPFLVTGIMVLAVLPSAAETFAAPWLSLAVGIAVVTCDIALARYVRRRVECRMLAERFQRGEHHIVLLCADVDRIVAATTGPQRWLRLRAAGVVLAMSRGRIMRESTLAELTDALRHLGVGDEAGRFAEAVVRARRRRRPLVAALADALTNEESYVPTTCRSPADD